MHWMVYYTCYFTNTFSFRFVVNSWIYYPLTFSQFHYKNTDSLHYKLTEIVDDNMPRKNKDSCSRKGFLKRLHSHCHCHAQRVYLKSHTSSSFKTAACAVFVIIYQHVHAILRPHIKWLNYCQSTFHLLKSCKMHYFTAITLYHQTS